MILDLKMPKGCLDCPFNFNGYCTAQTVYYDTSVYRPDGYVKLVKIETDGSGTYPSADWREPGCPIIDLPEEKCENCKHFINKTDKGKGWAYGSCTNCKESLTGWALRDPNWYCADFKPMEAGENVDCGMVTNWRLMDNL